MDRLLTPDLGLTIWTMVSFLGLVLILSRVAWKPLIQALSDREEGIRRAIDDAQGAKKSSEELKAKYEQELRDAQAKAQAIFNQAQADANKVREKLIADAQAEAQRLTESTRQQLAEEQNRLIRELRKEVAQLSVQAAEKLLKSSINKKVQDDVLQDFFKQLDQTKN